MRIEYLKLENFATIYSGMKRKSIEIDFTKCKNKIVLLIGDNGTGKTAILSELHPFAYAGSMDVRSDSSIIMPDKNGYKEIHISHEGNLYIIKHHYKNNKGKIMVKSFISKNGEELNANGNVTSFLSLVKQELTIEQDYLKLIRLGSNVTNIIEMKATERKNFTSQLLSEIEEYNTLYKKISEDTRVVKSIMKNITDKIYKLNIEDETTVKHQLKSLEESQDKYMKLRDELQMKAGVIKGTIDTSLGTDYDSFVRLLNDSKSEKDYILGELNKYGKKLNDYPIFITNDMDLYIKDIEENINRFESDIAVEESKVNILNQQLNVRYNERDDVRIQMGKLKSDVEHSRLSEHYVNLTNRYETLKVLYGNSKPSMTKDELLVLVDACENINNLASKIFGYSDSSIKEAIRLIKSKENIDVYVAKEVSKIDKKIMNLMTSNKIESKANDVIVLFKPQGCPFDDCPYDVLYDKIFGKDKNKMDVTEKVLNDRRDELMSIASVGKLIDSIFLMLKSYDTSINKCNLKQFHVESILENIYKIKYPMNDSELTKMISAVEDYNEFLNLKTEIKEVKAELASYKERNALNDSLQQRLVSIEMQISDIMSDMNKSDRLIEDRKNKIGILKDKLDNAKSVKEIKDITTKLYSRLDLVDNDIDHKKKVLKRVESELENLDLVNKQIETTNWELDKTKEEIFNLRYTLEEFRKLKAEQELLNDKYEDLMVIREALSSNKGIPLLYMQLYLKNSKNYVNELLSLVYGDDFAIDDFEISSSEFNIPYIKRGVRVNDVVRASQGERSFLSLALSFALINQSIKDYNVLLLDEIDATLDTRKRGLFLSVLERQMEVIDAEQVFLITHNDMFDSYPVDVIMTSDGHSVSDNQNVIFKGWK